MLGFFLNFFGLNPYGFKRKNSFLNLFAKIFQNKNIKYIGAIFVSCVFLICDYCHVSFHEAIKCTVSGHFLNLKYVVNNMAKVPNMISAYIDLNQENKNLKKEIDNLKINIIKAQDSHQELAKLKQAVNLNYSFEGYKTIEKILGFEKTAYESFLIISSTHNNAKKGMFVIASTGLVGLLIDSGNEISRVMTLSDSKIFVPVKSQSGEHFIISGNGKNKMFAKEMKNNTKSLKINIGDVLCTSGDGGCFAPDIPVAKITGIGKNGEVTCSPIANLHNTAFVFVVERCFSVEK